MMAFDLSQITQGVQHRPPRIILLGTHKIGKSTFASQFPNPVLMPVKGEEGIDDINTSKLPLVTSWQDCLAWLSSLYSNKHGYQTVVIDSVSTLEPLIQTYVCEQEKAPSIEKVGGGYGKGYVEALKYWHQLTEGLDALREHRGMASIMIGHAVISHFEDPLEGGYDRYDWDLHKKAKAQLFRWADCILFCNTKKLVSKEETGFGKEVGRARDVQPDQRFLYTKQRAAHPGGGRGVYGRLPYEILLDYDAFQAAISAEMGF